MEWPAHLLLVRGGGVSIRVMKIMQNLGFICQLLVSTTILEGVVEPLLLTIRIQK